MRQNTEVAPTVLNSWKEIASYLQRGVRTVQRWERDLHLPVHRIGTGKRSPVYATVSELKFWLATSAAARREYSNTAQEEPRPALVTRRERSAVEDSRRLLVSVRELARQIAETSVRQRRQTEDLQARILQMRAKVR